METRPDAQSSDSYAPPSGAAKTPPPEKASVIEDFIDIFYAPSTVFARREKSGFGLQLLIVAVIAALFAFANRGVMSAVFDAEFQRNIAKAMAENPQLTDDMVATQRGVMQKVAMFGSYVGTPILIFIVAVLIWLASKMVSAKVSYQQAVLIMTLAFVPRLVQALLTTVQSLLMDTATVTSMHALSFSPARFMDPETEQRALLGLMGRLDLFIIWSTVLIAIGIAVIGKVPKARAAVAAFGVWLVGTLPMLR